MDREGLEQAAWGLMERLRDYGMSVQPNNPSVDLDEDEAVNVIANFLSSFVEAT